MFSLSTLTIYRLTQHFITLGMEKPSWQNMFKETDHNDSHASGDSVSMQFRWNVTPTFYFMDQLDKGDLQTYLVSSCTEWRKKTHAGKNEID